ncbi:hypothetical protein JHK87_055796 [Glycine soja]|nr:hypothetical protein JHK87_055796 [Glycine soja]
MQGHRFKEWGFDKGWGNIAGRVKETMKLLYEVVYILDQVRALEEELLHKIELQVLDVKPQILVCFVIFGSVIVLAYIGLFGIGLFAGFLFQFFVQDTSFPSKSKND